MRNTVIAIVGITAVILVGMSAFLLRIVFREPPPTPKTFITIREGSTVSEINKLLEESGILVGKSLSPELEGYLFPDTYEFFLDSSVEVVSAKLTENFNGKIKSLFGENITEEDIRRFVIIASLIEAEVPHPEDRKIVAGIIEKRIALGMPLQIDATICYIKGDPCLPITDDDKKIDSPYNTYLYGALPPGPIGNPGLDALEASKNPQTSPYLYYLSDPDTGVTIFASTLDEHNSNVVKYLGN